jgi:periplasmic mercuric ion binding protein
MKTKVLSVFLFLFLAGTIVVSAATKTEKIKVSGNCGMCETRIEKAAGGITGVSAADWDKKTKKLTVTYDPAVTDKSKIEKAVALVGHDTETQKADDAVYNALPGCCKYR